MSKAAISLAFKLAMASADSVDVYVRPVGHVAMECSIMLDAYGDESNRSK